MMERIAEIKARCEAGRPLRRIDIKYLLTQLTERDAEIERLTERLTVTEELYNASINVKGAKQ